jgi:hypothetical protein
MNGLSGIHSALWFNITEIRCEGMTEGENYRDLLTRLSTALAMTEAAYLEARRRRDLSLVGGTFYAGGRIFIRCRKMLC